MACYNLGKRKSVSKRKSTNPFYILLLLAGIAFAITACAYGVMTVRQLRATRVVGYDFDLNAESKQPAPDFNELLDRYGATAMILEIALLGIPFLALGAIAIRIARRFPGPQPGRAAPDPPPA